ncbi:selenocysteine-specific translation elongation factor [Bacillus sp. Marseille-Q3570]|uniref:selenocysteine-specific translation elongation factor n=1 Tax=Bacillus sp. Marseille-Q3570 TaxID=2963522 RepID=UPI0021B720AC|nr:selenocysteine-specific translation elongation factor [Bacillus sp. Marseille-Q3570]
MADTYLTIGMAGHIDHGKTSLTKALTDIDTDRLKEEKERNISIELGYAPFDLGKGLQVSIIDVPGHERFIRQMIAGVAGIDFVILVVAADEGVMPQTKEHAEILSYLGIEHAAIAVTKSSKVDTEMLSLVEEDIRSEFTAGPFAKAPMFFVDSLAKKGLEELKKGIIEELPKIKQRDSSSKFRMPIDQAFTLKGKGAIVRGTVFEGTVHEGEEVILLPGNEKVRVRQLQVHKQTVEYAVAGQRAAINVGGVSSKEIARGDQLTTNRSLSPSKSIDLVLDVNRQLDYDLKQRSRVKLHTGTSEVMGTIVFFDRNELRERDPLNILCQVRLDEEISVLRGDRFIIRRPSPIETIGGGWVLDPFGEKYKFGSETIDMLQKKMEGTSEERITRALEKMKAATIPALSKEIGESEKETERTVEEMEKQDIVVNIDTDLVALSTKVDSARNQLEELLADYHDKYPMRIGPGKAEVIQELKLLFPGVMIEFALSESITKQSIVKIGHYLKRAQHTPSFPKQWEKRLQNVIQQLKEAGFKHEGLEEMFNQQSIPQDYFEELERYLIETGQAVTLEDGTFVHRAVFDKALISLRDGTSSESFTVQDAKAILELSRKYCILFLEKVDALGMTIRVDDQRKWVNHKLEKYLADNQ